RGFRAREDLRVCPKVQSKGPARGGEAPARSRPEMSGRGWHHSEKPPSVGCCDRWVVSDGRRVMVGWAPLEKAPDMGMRLSVGVPGVGTRDGGVVTTRRSLPARSLFVGIQIL